jgi:hypothetical protein
MVYMAAVTTWDTLTGMTAKRFAQVASKNNDYIVYIHKSLTLKGALNYSQNRGPVNNWN